MRNSQQFFSEKTSPTKPMEIQADATPKQNTVEVIENGGKNITNTTQGIDPSTTNDAEPIAERQEMTILQPAIQPIIVDHHDHDHAVVPDVVYVDNAGGKKADTVSESANRNMRILTLVVVAIVILVAFKMIKRGA